MMAHPQVVGRQTQISSNLFRDMLIEVEPANQLRVIGFEGGEDAGNTSAGRSLLLSVRWGT